MLDALENELAKAVIIGARDHNLKLLNGNRTTKFITCFNCNSHSSTCIQTTQTILQIELVLHLDLVLHLLNSINIFATSIILVDGISPKIKFFFPFPFGWDAHFWGDWVRLSPHLHVNEIFWPRPVESYNFFSFFFSQSICNGDLGWLLHALTISSVSPESPSLQNQWWLKKENGLILISDSLHTGSVRFAMIRMS